MKEFLGHYNRETKEGQILNEHCSNVAELSASFLMKSNLGHLGYLCGAIHDLGKSKKEFLDYLYHGLESQRGTIDHASTGPIFLNEEKFNLPKNKLAIEIISQVIFSHHSGLHDMLKSSGKFTYGERLCTDKEKICYDECIKNYKKEGFLNNEISQYLDEAANELEELCSHIVKRYHDKVQIKFELGLAVRLVFSSLIDADRLDTANFFYHRKLNIQDDSNEIWDRLILRLENHLETLHTDSKINQLRNIVSKQCKEFARNDQGIYQFYAPTGAGKTLGSLRFALYHAKKNQNIKHIFYVIPYLSIITQNAKSIRDVLQENDESIILEHYSTLLSDDEEKHRLHTERWDTPIIFTTYVQLLNTLFDGSSQSARRMHQLTDSILIFDEIQSLPINCTNIFNTAMNFLSKECHSTVVLCSATQPILNKTSRPILFNYPKELIKDTTYNDITLNRTNVIDYTTLKLTFNNAALFVVEKMESVDSILVVLNRKKDALAVYKEIKAMTDDKYKLFYLSTDLCPKHREDTIKTIFNTLGNEKVICISTDIISAGVDLSFNCVVRCCAGLDRILQAAGRCNRNGEWNQANVYIISLLNENLNKLEDIQMGQLATISVLNDIKNNPKKYEDGNILCKAAINEYYRLYYGQQDNKGKLDYELKDGNNLYNLLSNNSKGVVSYQEAHPNEVPKCILRQAFSEAGSQFEVIKRTPTKGVIVPYGEGKNIIIKLLSKDLEFEELDCLLKKAQLYAINLFDFQISNICVQNIESLGVLILNEKNYDEVFGLDIEGKSYAYF